MSEIKMGDVFELPVSSCDVNQYHIIGDESEFHAYADGADAAVHAINNHDRLTAENEALREEVERLRAERDKVQAQNNRVAKILNEAPEADRAFTDEEMVVHNADVIEWAANHVAGLQPMEAYDYDRYLREYANQLRQQAKNTKT